MPSPTPTSKFTSIYPTSIDAHSPKSILNVPLSTDVTQFIKINWTDLILSHDLSGRYFGCSIEHSREYGRTLEQSNLYFSIYDDDNFTSLFWKGAYCIPDSCNGLSPFIVEIDYPKIQNHWVWFMQVYSDPPAEHPFKDLFIIDCEVSWRTVTIIGLTIGGSVLFVCIIGFCGLFFWPLIINCMRRNMIEYLVDPNVKKPKKDKRKYRDAYRRKKNSVVVVPPPPETGERKEDLIPVKEKSAGGVDTSNEPTTPKGSEKVSDNVVVDLE